MLFLETLEGPESSWMILLEFWGAGWCFIMFLETCCGFTTPGYYLEIFKWLCPWWKQLVKIDKQPGQYGRELEVIWEARILRLLLKTPEDSGSGKHLRWLCSPLRYLWQQFSMWHQFTLKSFNWPSKSLISFNLLSVVYCYQKDFIMANPPMEEKDLFNWIFDLRIW